MNRNPYNSSRPRSRFDDGRASRRTMPSADSRRRPQPSRYGAPRQARPAGQTAPARRLTGKTPVRGSVNRRSEVSMILLRSAVALAALAVLLGVFFLIKPGLDIRHASRLARTGDVDQAEAAINRLQRDGRSPKRIEDVRAQLAERYIAEGDFDAALSLTGAMADAERARALEQRANYVHAAALYDQGDYEAAARLFYALGDYEDAPGRYAECRCAMAVSAYLAGRESEARYLLLDTDDAVDHIQSAALAVTGDAQQAASLLATELFSAANLQQMARDKQAVSTARTQAAPHRLAAGYRHTAALKADGTVLTAGNNDSGQCNVLGWTDIREIAAGAAHTVGLKADGTVVATGDNSYGQCDVTDWTGIQSVAASAYGTFGLRSDGTVVATRSYTDKVTGWRGVTQIAAGSYSAGGLYGQGSMVCTHEGARLDMGASLFGLSVCGPVSAALLPDGSLYANVASAPAWHGLTQIAVSQTGMMGVFSDGSCHGFSFRDGQDVALNIDGQVIEAASSGTHHVALTSDGRVFAFGENGDGQCDVTGWSLS